MSSLGYFFDIKKLARKVVDTTQQDNGNAISLLFYGLYDVLRSKCVFALYFISIAVLKYLNTY